MKLYIDIIIILYVDDLNITRKNEYVVAGMKYDLNQSVDMSYLGLLHYYYEIEIWQQPNLIFMPQIRYAPI